MISEATENVCLYYRDDRSDKVYQLQLIGSEGGFVVNFQFGRRGTSLQSGTKTSEPVPHAKALKIYQRLVSEKKGKGYIEAQASTPYQTPSQAKQQSDLLPQLLNPVEESETNRLIADPAWLMQEKKDGRRVLIRRTGMSIQGANRKGQIIPLPSVVEHSVQSLDCDLVLDGESVGDIYWIFDLLELNGEDLRPLSTSSRLVALNRFEQEFRSGALRLVSSAWTSEAKRELFRTLKAERAEGVVFKRVDAPYVPGRPNSGGTQLKYKFTSSATCKVMGQNEGKRSVSLAVYQDQGDSWIAVGNVTIPPNFPVPEVWSLVEVRYLYYFPGGSLYQPVYLGLRTDVECADSVKSLKFKQDRDDEE
jgi:bifunctional non-homologous end joining protein LigD